MAPRTFERPPVPTPVFSEDNPSALINPAELLSFVIVMCIPCEDQNNCNLRGASVRLFDAPGAYIFLLEVSRATLLLVDILPR
jgi:hypothetical protein